MIEGAWEQFVALQLAAPAIGVIVEALLRSTMLVLAAAGFLRLLRGRASSLRRDGWAALCAGVTVIAAIALAELWPAAGGVDNTWISDDRPLIDGGLMVALWLVPTGVLLLRLGCGQAFLTRWLRGSAAAREPAWNADLARIARESGATLPELCIVEGLRAPLATGLLRPRILLPAAMLGAPASLRRAVLLHELEHLQARDIASRWAAGLGCAMLWFNPLVWWAARRLRFESERAGDDAVLRGGVSALEYARHLVGLAESMSSLPSSAVAAGLGESEIFRRVDAIGDPRIARRPPRTTQRWAVVIVVAALVVSTLSIALPRPRLLFLSAEPGESVFVRR